MCALNLFFSIPWWYQLNTNMVNTVFLFKVRTHDGTYLALALLPAEDLLVALRAADVLRITVLDEI